MSSDSHGSETALDAETSCSAEGLPTRVERLFRQQNQALVRMLSARLHDAEAAREVAQQAYEEVFKRDKAGTLEKLSAATLDYLRNYLFKTARNIASDRLRQRARRIRDAHLVHLHCDPGEAPSAERLCIQHEEWECLRQAVADLPPKCKEAFVLVEFEGYSVPEVAERMAVKQNTVYQLCKRAYEHLMSALAESDRHHGGQS